METPPHTHTHCTWELAEQPLRTGRKRGGGGCWRKGHQLLGAAGSAARKALCPAPPRTHVKGWSCPTGPMLGQGAGGMQVQAMAPGEGRAQPPHPPYLDSGPAVKGEGLDLPVLQEDLQDVGDEQQSLLLQHVLGPSRDRPPPTVQEQQRGQGGCRRRREEEEEACQPPSARTCRPVRCPRGMGRLAETPPASAASSHPPCPEAIACSPLPWT